MRPPHTPKSPFNNILVPRLPEEILYLIGWFSSFESLATLVRCNRWLHNACSTLLFREIHIWSPAQVIKLYNNNKAIGMLNRTKCLVLGDNLFLGSSWEAIPNMSERDMLDQIVRILRAMPGLVQLQISGRYTDADSSNTVAREPSRRQSYQQSRRILAKHLSDPTFLPNLTALHKIYTFFPMYSLSRIRPVMYRCCLDPRYLSLGIYPGLVRPATFDTSTLEATHNVSANDVGAIIRNIKHSAPPLVSTLNLSLTMRFPDEIIQHKPCPIIDPLPWVKTMLAAAHLPADKLESIEVRFEPPPPHEALTAQHAAIEELHRSFPSLRHASISSPPIWWNPSTPRGDLPAWMVFPTLGVPETIGWWCNVLKLDYPDTQDNAKIGEMAKRLHTEMSLRWNIGWVPRIDELIYYLRHK